MNFHVPNCWIFLYYFCHPAAQCRLFCMNMSFSRITPFSLYLARSPAIIMCKHEICRKRSLSFPPPSAFPFTWDQLRGNREGSRLNRVARRESQTDGRITSAHRATRVVPKAKVHRKSPNCFLYAFRYQSLLRLDLLNSRI